jgi:hypothetical protein
VAALVEVFFFAVPGLSIRDFKSRLPRPPPRPYSCTRLCIYGTTTTFFKTCKACFSLKEEKEVQTYNDFRRNPKRNKR